MQEQLTVADEAASVAEAIRIMAQAKETGPIKITFDMDMGQSKLHPKINGQKVVEFMESLGLNEPTVAKTRIVIQRGHPLGQKTFSGYDGVNCVLDVYNVGILEDVFKDATDLATRVINGKVKSKQPFSGLLNVDCLTGYLKTSSDDSQTKTATTEEVILDALAGRLNRAVIESILFCSEDHGKNLYDLPPASTNRRLALAAVAGYTTFSAILGYLENQLGLDRMVVGSLLGMGPTTAALASAFISGIPPTVWLTDKYDRHLISTSIQKQRSSRAFELSQDPNWKDLVTLKYA